MRRLYEANKITPEFFYESVAKKMGVSKDIVKDIYTKYLSRVQEVSKKDLKIMIRGLGSFQVNPNKAFGRLYAIDRLIDKYWHEEEGLPDWVIERANQASELIKNLNTLKKKYEFIEGSMEKFWANQRRLAEFLDNQGNRREYIRKENANLQQLSEQERS